MQLFFIMHQARGQVVLYITSQISMIVHISTPERWLAQEKSREFFPLARAISYEKAFKLVVIDILIISHWM